MQQDCPSCGAHGVSMSVDSGEDANGENEAEGERVLVCPACGASKSFVSPPLCIVTGAAGTGKSTVRSELRGEIDAILLEDDPLWVDGLEAMTESEFNEYVLSLCAEVAQSGVQPVLFTTGMGVPDNVEGLDARQYFGESHYLALVCGDETQTERLRARPGWDDGEDYWADVERQVEFNQWFKSEGEGDGVELLDTTDATVAETVADVRAWIDAHS
jgi:hypothetical protein